MKNKAVRGNNPIIGQDYPDPDVIRVGDTYYMVSTTMYFMPGGVTLRSYDLINWEIASYVYETLDDTAAQRLEGSQNIYGQGMWAASIRYHKGVFYICFVANDTHKTYLYRSENIEGPWKKQTIEGFYHDCSLLFDEDDKVYIIYGNKTIHLTQLNAELTGPQIGGIDRVIVEDAGHPGLGYEGSHFYKINGRYYAFFIHSLRDRWFRTHACFSSDSLMGKFEGGDVVQNDMGYCGAGVAQGGIVDTPDGRWYSVLFQDRGAVGRIPVLVPLHWNGIHPIFGNKGKIPYEVENISTRPDYSYEPLYISDEFIYKPDEEGKVRLHHAWQWNHNPQNALWSVTERIGALRLHSGKVCHNLLQAYNMLTQRTAMNVSIAEVEVDGSHMKDGDYAGICAMLGDYGAIALTRNADAYSIVMLGRREDEGSSEKEDHTAQEVGYEYERVQVASPVIRLRVMTDFTNGIDEASFFYRQGKSWKRLGIKKKLDFKLDFFTGCRFGLFYFSSEKAGGYIDFLHFTYNKEE